jgi:MFS family permease
MTSHISAIPVHSAPPSALTGLVPAVIAIFLGFLSVSVPLAAMALHVHDHLGFNTAVVGWVIGIQSLATLLSRHQAGALCDRRGPRFATLVGLAVAASAGLVYVWSSALPTDGYWNVLMLVIGRIAAGVGESLFITGLMSWSISRMGVTRTGKVMSWSGIAIYSALGLGAPIGLALQTRWGFVGVGIASAVAPMLAWLLALRFAAVPGGGGQRVPFYRVIGLIWRPGLILALATVPYAIIASFLTLVYADHRWPGVGSALFGFCAAYLLLRLMGSGLADRIGERKVAVGSLIVETIGQALLWYAPGPDLALLGAIGSGLGFSLVFPAMGIIATRSVPPEQRGRAIGNFMAFADIALAATGPLVGLATLSLGVGATFIVGAGASCLALCLLSSLRVNR